MVLVLVDIQYNPEVARNRRFTKFVEWLVLEFRLSLPALAYSARLFGRTPLRKMMKFRPEDDAHRRKSAVFNMTWDLFLMNAFFRKWTSKEDKKETLFVSNDLALKEILRSAVAAQTSGTMESLGENLEMSVWEPAREMLTTYAGRTDRVYGSESWSPEYRAGLIQHFEERLLA